MTTVIDAIYANGMLKPSKALPLRDQQRVRLIVQTIDRPSTANREAALRRFFAGVEAMNFHLEGPLPTREELHERL